MSHSSPNGPKNPIDAVLGQYTDAADHDRDHRFETTNIEALPSTGDAALVIARQKHVRSALYPNLGSSGNRMTNDDSAATELQDK